MGGSERFATTHQQTTLKWYDSYMKIAFPKTIKGKVFAVCFLVLFLVVAVLLIQRLYIYYNPQALINYKIFAPAYLPDGLKVQETTVRAETPSSLLWWVTPDLSVEISLNGEYGTIGEIASDSNHLGSCDSDYVIVGLKCEIGTTTSGVYYIRSLIYRPSNYDAQPLVYDRLSEENIYFIKNGTVIKISLSSDIDQPISLDEWDKTIDSFQEVELTNYTILHAHPGP